MESTTLRQVKADFLNVYNQHSESSILRRLSMPRTTTTVGTVSTLLDSVLGRGTVASHELDRCQIEIVEAVTDGPALGEASGVDSSGFTDPATITVSPAFTLAVQTGTDYLIYPPDLSPELVNAEVNNLLRGTEGPHLWWPSLVTDADFEAADLTNWDAVGAPTTREFVTTTANVLFNERSLHVASAAGVGAQSELFNVHERESLLLAVHARVASGGLTVQLYDETNSAVVRAVTVDEPAWTLVRFTDPAPSGCKQMRVRFLGSVASSDFYVASGVIVQATSGRPYAAPSWLPSEKKVLGAISWHGEYPGVEMYSYVALSGMQRVPYRLLDYTRQDRGVTGLYVELAAEGFPVAVIAYRPFAELSINTSTTPCHREYMRWKLMANIRRRCGQDDWPTFQRTAMQIAGAQGYGLRENKMVDNPMVAV